MMNQKDRDAFEQCWVTFRTKVEGRLLKRNRNGLLTELQYDQILRDSALDWGSDETLCGRWLRSYAEREPQKAEKIQAVLQGIQFHPVPPRRGIPNAAEIIAPVAGLGTGLFISRQLHASLLTQAAAALLPAGLVYLSVHSARTQLQEKHDQEQLREHLEQLTMFHDQILDILMQS